MTHGITPLDVKVLLLPDPVEEKTAGGIIRPDMLRDREKYATTRCTLLAVGESAFAEWKGDRPQVGDRVITAQYAGVNVKGEDGSEYRLCNDEDVIAVLEAAPQPETGRHPLDDGYGVYVGANLGVAA